MKYIPKVSSENKENRAVLLPVMHIEERSNGLELNLSRVEFSKNSSRRFSDVNSKNHGASRASDIDYGLNLGMV